MITYINTEKIAELGNDIISLATDFELEITKLYKRFGEVPTITKEWVGQESTKYFQMISLDKQDYMNLGNQLRNYGKEVTAIADRFEKQIKENAEVETKKEYR